MAVSWRPSATTDVIKARAELYRAIRDFFNHRNVLEVEVPVLASGATVDPYIESLSTQVCGERFYLQTSPEFYLKRLLCAGIGSMYSLGKAFRNGERGVRHRPEFTLLEWYRLGWDEHQLIAELGELITQLIPGIEVTYCRYQALFQQHLQLDPHQAELAQLQQCVQRHIDIDLASASRSVWLDLLMTHCIEPQLPNGLVFIYDYPACQAALARTLDDTDGQLVAKRFEAYVNGVELANGYLELTDANEQRRRFEDDVSFRAQQGLDVVPYDRQLVAALEAGMPECAGVALGVDRLLMAMLKLEHIDQVMTF